jgi:O-Antigen ligase
MNRLANTGFHFWLLVAFLVMTFLSGGSSRADVQSLIIMRPAAIIVCGIALWQLTPDKVRSAWSLLIVTGLIILLPLLQLIPLPWAVWTDLPGRLVSSRADVQLGLSEIARPLSLVPISTLDALYSLAAPTAVVLLGIHLNREERFLLLPVILVIGLLSGILGVIQSIGDPYSPLFLYRITNPGFAVGLFANRNHQALLLASLFPILAIYAAMNIRDRENLRRKGIIALLASIVIIPLLLVTGSRAGIVIGIAGLVIAGILYEKPEVSVSKKRKLSGFDPTYVIAFVGILVLGLTTFLTSRAIAVQRLLDTGHHEELRFEIWGPIAKIGWTYFPFGSGIGTFANIYALGEPDDLLIARYYNQAHSDWLDLFLAVGAPGIIILALVGWMILRAAFRALRAGSSRKRETRFVKLALTLIFFLMAGSTVDYPLRAPSLSCLLMVCLLWLMVGEHKEPVKQKARNSKVSGLASDVMDRI